MATSTQDGPSAIGLVESFHSKLGCDVLRWPDCCRTHLEDCKSAVGLVHELMVLRSEVWAVFRALRVRLDVVVGRAARALGPYSNLFLHSGGVPERAEEDGLCIQCLCFG